jgi:hypothetical protein
MEQRYQRTQEKMQYIQDNGYAMKQMWECDWERLKKEHPAVKAFVKDMQRPCDGQFKMMEETILRAVMEDRMFGALEVDLEVPDYLKGKFAEMPPIFKNTDVSRDDIGDHMKMYAEERGIMNQTRKCLIGSMFGQKILIISLLLKWYVQHGLKVTKIHQVVEYTPAICFQKFGEQVSDARRAEMSIPARRLWQRRRN